MRFQNCWMVYCEKCREGLNFAQGGFGAALSLLANTLRFSRTLPAVLFLRITSQFGPRQAERSFLPTLSKTDDSLELEKHVCRDFRTANFSRILRNGTRCRCTLVLKILQPRFQPRMPRTWFTCCQNPLCSLLGPTLRCVGEGIRLCSHLLLPRRLHLLGRKKGYDAHGIWEGERELPHGC